MSEKIFSVYRITNKINSKIYIGYTEKTVEQRWKDHVGNRNVKNYHFSCAIRKYGAESFSVETMWQSKFMDAAKETEMLLIKEYGSHEREVGYNLTMGGEGESVTQGVRDRIAAANRGKKRDKKTKKLLSESHKGLIYQDENLRLFLDLKEKGFSNPEISTEFASREILSRTGKPISVSVFHNVFKRLLSDEVRIEGFSLEKLKEIESLSLQASDKKVQENWKNKDRISATRVSKIYEQENLRKIWEMRQSGSTLQQIADWANKEGILNNHGKPFSYVAFSFIFQKIKNGQLTLNME